MREWKGVLVWSERQGELDWRGINRRAPNQKIYHSNQRHGAILESKPRLPSHPDFRPTAVDYFQTSHKIEWGTVGKISCNAVSKSVEPKKMRHPQDRLQAALVAGGRRTPRARDVLLMYRGEKYFSQTSITFSSEKA